MKWETEEIAKFYQFSCYLIDPNHHRFPKVCRILALVIKFVANLKSAIKNRATRLPSRNLRPRKHLPSLATFTSRLHSSMNIISTKLNHTSTRKQKKLKDSHHLRNVNTLVERRTIYYTTQDALECPASDAGI